MLLYGFVYIDGVRAGLGVLIEAQMEGETVASEETTTLQGQSGYYMLRFFGGEPGDPVALFVDGEEANESPVAYEVGSQMLNLTVGSMQPTTRTLTMSVTGKGETDPPVGESAYLEGTVVTIRAFPAEDWRFDHWTGAVSAPSSPVSTVIMDADKSVTASFVQVLFLPVVFRGHPVD